MIVGYCLIREFLGIFEAACAHPTVMEHLPAS
jgi:hypothetical protein